MITDTTTPAQAPPPSTSSANEVEPSDYATLNAVYGLILASLALATRRRGGAEPIRGAELVPMGAATFALSKVIAREKIGSWVREPFVEDGAADDDGPQPRGGGLKRAVAELVTCTRCVGAWSAMAVVGLRVASPSAGRTVTAVLTASAVNDWMQTGFRYICAKANAATD
jgi:hypothetical protein